MKLTEFNFDGLVGPTHNHSGLSFDNVASTIYKDQVSSPKEAALEGLEKMFALYQRGRPQGIIPPLIRPKLSFISSMGLSNNDNDWVLGWQQFPEFMRAIYSASSMWVANAATFTPSTDSSDGKPHFTPANLISHLHRSIEKEETYYLLKKIFPEPFFKHHSPLDSHRSLSDEGAANHMRLCHPDDTGRAIHVFVYGNGSGRQSLKASRIIAHRHGILDSSIFIQQNPKAIEQGVFHNDVVAISHNNFLLHHEDAFALEDITLLQQAFYEKTKTTLQIHTVSSKEIHLETAIQTYLFNSQIIDNPNGFCLIAPSECQSNNTVKHYIDKLIQDPTNPIQEVSYFNLRESMRNGGGPACLRLRILLNEEEISKISNAYLITETKYKQIKDFINNNYPNHIDITLLQDRKFALHCRKITQQLHKLFDL